MLTQAQLDWYLEQRLGAFQAGTRLTGVLGEATEAAEPPDTGAAGGVTLIIEQAGSAPELPLRAAVYILPTTFSTYGAQTALDAGIRALTSVQSRSALLPSAQAQPAPLVYRIDSGPSGPQYRAARPGY